MKRSAFGTVLLPAMMMVVTMMSGGAEGVGFFRTRKSAVSSAEMTATAVAVSTSTSVAGKVKKRLQSLFGGSFGRSKQLQKQEALEALRRNSNVLSRASFTAGLVRASLDKQWEQMCKTGTAGALFYLACASFLPASDYQDIIAAAIWPPTTTAAAAATRSGAVKNLGKGRYHQEMMILRLWVENLQLVARFVLSCRLVEIVSVAAGDVLLGSSATASSSSLWMQILSSIPAAYKHGAALLLAANRLVLLLLNNNGGVDYNALTKPVKERTWRDHAVVAITLLASIGEFCILNAHFHCFNGVAGGSGGGNPVVQACLVGSVGWLCSKVILHRFTESWSVTLESKEAALFDVAAALEHEEEDSTSLSDYSESTDALVPDVEKDAVDGPDDSTTDDIAPDVVVSDPEEAHYAAEVIESAESVVEESSDETTASNDDEADVTVVLENVISEKTRSDNDNCNVVVAVPEVSSGKTAASSAILAFNAYTLLWAQSITKHFLAMFAALKAFLKANICDVDSVVVAVPRTKSHGCEVGPSTTSRNVAVAVLLLPELPAYQIPATTVQRRRNPKTTVAELAVGTVAVAFLSIVYTLGMDIPRWLRDATVSLATWSLVGFMYDHVMAMRAAAGGADESPLELLIKSINVSSSSSVLGGAPHSTTTVVALQKKRPSFPTLRPPVPMEEIVQVVAAESAGTTTTSVLEEEEEEAYPNDDTGLQGNKNDNNGRTKSRRFETVEVPTTPASTHDPLSEVSVTQTHYFEPVNLLQAVFRAFQAGTTARKAVACTSIAGGGAV